MCVAQQITIKGAHFAHLLSFRSFLQTWPKRKWPRLSSTPAVACARLVLLVTMHLGFESSSSSCSNCRAFLFAHGAWPVIVGSQSFCAFTHRHNVSLSEHLGRVENDGPCTYMESAFRLLEISQSLSTRRAGEEEGARV